jgi:hypothetical protein
MNSITALIFIPGLLTCPPVISRIKILSCPLLCVDIEKYLLEFDTFEKNDTQIVIHFFCVDLSTRLRVGDNNSFSLKSSKQI